jgi:hypothetical protein
LHVDTKSTNVAWNLTALSSQVRGRHQGGCLGFCFSSGERRDVARAPSRAVHIILSLRGGKQKRQNLAYVKYCGTLILAVLFASLALSEDFKTINGKVYKDATVRRVEADGIELKTNRGIFKVYFPELPKDVQERFHWAPPEPPRKPFYDRWAAAAEDPAVLAKIIAAGSVILAIVGLVIRYIRSRRQPTMRARRASHRKAVHRARS